MSVLSDLDNAPRFAVPRAPRCGWCRHGDRPDRFCRLPAGHEGRCYPTTLAEHRERRMQQARVNERRVEERRLRRVGGSR